MKLDTHTWPSTGKLSFEELVTKYAHLLVHYCLELKSGEKLLVKASTNSIPLVQEVYKEATKSGVHVEVDLEFESKNEIFFKHADEDLLKEPPHLYSHCIEHYNAYLLIRSPFDLLASGKADPKKKAIRRKFMKPIQQKYFQRTGNGELKRTLCEFASEANAEMAGLSREDFAEFIFNACKLYDENPADSWLEVRSHQQHIVDYLNKCSHLRYKNKLSDISFSVKDRIWINSDGRNNMPSGEVFTGPVEDTVNGVIHFDFPSVYQGKKVAGITLYVKDGEVYKWEAKEGKELLDRIFEIDGAKFFGEVAIGTNYNINRPSCNILFDEKIGGTVHMAIGQSYAQTGGKNVSAIHWDMISDMRDGGQIYADGELIYQDGKFII